MTKIPWNSPSFLNIKHLFFFYLSSSTALGYGLDDRGFEFWHGWEFFSSPPHLGPTQPPIQWLPGATSLGLKRPGREADQSHPSSAEVKNAWSYIPNPPLQIHGVVLSKKKRSTATLPFSRVRSMDTVRPRFMCPDHVVRRIKKNPLSFAVFHFPFTCLSPNTYWDRGYKRRWRKFQHWGT
jgi:hypothetical protein